MMFSGLDGLSFIEKSSLDGVDYTSDVLGRFLFLWRLSFMSLLLLSLSTSVFRSSSVCFVVLMLLILVFSGSFSYLVVVQPLNELG